MSFGECFYLLTGVSAWESRYVVHMAIRCEPSGTASLRSPAVSVFDPGFRNPQTFGAEGLFELRSLSSLESVDFETSCISFFRLSFFIASKRLRLSLP
jgi:hypothetical protein